MAEYGDFGGTDFNFGGGGLAGNFGAYTPPADPFGVGTPDWGTDSGQYFDPGMFSTPSYSDSGVSGSSSGSFGTGNYGDYGADPYSVPNEEEDRLTRTPGKTMGMGPKTPGFWDSGFGKLMRGVTSLPPVGRLGWGMYDLAQGKSPLQVGANLLTGLPGMFARGALDYSNNKNMGAAVGTQAGGLLGGMFGNAISPGLGVVTGPMGASMGRAMGGTPGINGTAGQSQGNANSFGVNEILSGLGGLYSSNQANKALGANQDAISGQISSLSGMYGPDSPYAKQLRQTLERQDAKAGRNSQYGPREAQLQALLAEKAAGAASTVGNLAGQSQKLNDQRTMQRNQQLGILLGMGQRSGLFNGLSGMFNQSQAPQAEAPFIDYGEYL